MTYNHRSHAACQEVSALIPWYVNGSIGEHERQRVDALRLLRQVPAIVSLTLVDGSGKERLHVSRVGLNRVGSGADRANDPAVVGARSARVWYGPVTFYRGSEPFMTVDILILFMTCGHRSSLSQHRRLPDCKYPVGNVAICGQAPKDEP